MLLIGRGWLMGKREVVFEYKIFTQIRWTVSNQ
jgi:hypothetical protein